MPTVLFKCKEKYLNINLSEHESEIFSSVYNIGIKHKYLRRHKEALEILNIHPGECHSLPVKDIHLDGDGNLIWHSEPITLSTTDNTTERKIQKIQLLNTLIIYGLDSFGNNSFVNLEKHEFDSDEDAKLWFEMEYSL